MYQLTNHLLRITITARGAELQSIFHMAEEHEYMWSGDPAFWGKKSPVLFPIVGGLRNNTYHYQNKPYSLPRHGFARDSEFAVTAQSANSITFTLAADTASLQVYPFLFRFSITYTLAENRLTIDYLVENTDETPLYFSVGAHPAFAVPLAEGLNYTDCYLAFNEPENSVKWPLSSEGLIQMSSEAFFQKTSKLPLSKELFYGDALVFKDLQSTAISILNDKTSHGLTVRFKDFPYMGIWSAKNADFVCIEPWCGIADSVDASGNIEAKEGVNKLEPGSQFTRSWSVEVF